METRRYQELTELKTVRLYVGPTIQACVVQGPPEYVSTKGRCLVGVLCTVTVTETAACAHLLPFVPEPAA